MAITCISATAITPTCASATVLGPNMVITDSLGNVITLDEILDLFAGDHVFTISNTGEGRLHIFEIVVSDSTYSVTQPADRDLEPGETTTFTVTSPAP